MKYMDTDDVAKRTIFNHMKFLLCFARAS